MADKPTLNGSPPLLKPKMPDPNEMADAALRRMNHGDWLGEFAKMLEMEIPGRDRPMSPFRMGAITRLKLAQRYIRLLETDLRKANERIKHGPQHIEDIPEGR